MTPFYRCGSTIPRLQRHFKETVYFLPPKFTGVTGADLINLCRVKG